MSEYIEQWAIEKARALHITVDGCPAPDSLYETIARGFISVVKDNDEELKQRVAQVHWKDVEIKKLEDKLIRVLGKLKTMIENKLYCLSEDATGRIRAAIKEGEEA